MFEGLFQPLHLMIIAGIALLVFGPKKLPELGKGLGDGIRGFKTAMSGEDKTADGKHSEVKPILDQPIEAANPKETSTIA